MTDYEKLIAECVEQMDAPLPTPCGKTKNCRRVGGCMEYYGYSTQQPQPARSRNELRGGTESALHGRPKGSQVLGNRPYLLERPVGTGRPNL
jgi:hypothetical protein